MNMIRVIASAAAMTIAALSAGGAEAAQYNVSYTTNLDAGGTSLFSGIFTTTDTADVNGFFTVTNITGTRGVSAATLSPLNTFGGNDNLFKPTGNFVNLNGVTFSAGGFNYNLYYSGGLREFQVGNVTNFAVSPVNGAVPEPATWAMLILGMAAIGYSMRRSNVKFDAKIKRMTAAVA